MRGYEVTRKGATASSSEFHARGLKSRSTSSIEAVASLSEAENHEFPPVVGSKTNFQHPQLNTFPRSSISSGADGILRESSFRFPASPLALDGPNLT